MGVNREEYQYDGSGRRVRLTRKASGIVQSDTTFMLCGSELCEERDAQSNAVGKALFAGGDLQSSESRFVVRDHLGSIRAVADEAVTLLARTDFDPFGRPTAVQGALEERSGFTGHRYSVVSDLSMSPSRLHDPSIGRWISEDPLGFADGPNRYAYSRNAPTTTVDPDGALSAKVTGHDPQRFSDYSELKWACKGIWALVPGVVYGCAGVVVDDACSCVATDCGQWKALTSIEIDIHMLVLDIPGGSVDLYIREEAKHFNYFYQWANERIQAAKQLERQRFSNRVGCWLACYSWLRGNDKKDDPTHRTNPHPY